MGDRFFTPCFIGGIMKNYAGISLPRHGAYLGFSDLFDHIEREINAPPSSYPPYNLIQKDDGDFIIELAVAGFTEDRLKVEIFDSELKITGIKACDGVDVAKHAGRYVHNGLANRSFSRSFHLRDLEVNEAKLENGILKVFLKNTRLSKIRTIPINTGPVDIESQDKQFLTG